jgi:hypothetical protein
MRNPFVRLPGCFPPGLAVLSLCLAVLLPVRAIAQLPEDLANQISNPISGLRYLPFQENGDFNMGATGAYRNTLNVQPVVPFALNERWNLITRTIMPIVFQQEMTPGIGDKFGLGDLTTSGFFSPVKESGPMWGIGPALLLPLATSSLLGGGKFGFGPTAVLIWQDEKWTFGALANQIWSFTGDSAREDISSMFLQPTVTRNMGNGTTVTANLEATRDWKHDTWNVPLNVIISKVTMMGVKWVQASGGLRLYLTGPEGSPDWGFRLGLTFLYPK